MTTTLIDHPTATDVIDALAGLSADSRTGRLSRQRYDVRRFTQGSFDALFGRAGDDETDELARAERELVALRVALLQREPALTAFHRERALALDVGPGLLAAPELQPVRPAGDDRWSAVLRFTDRLTLEPAAA